MKAIQIISQDLFDKVRSRFQNLEMGDETGAVTIDPVTARFFDFDFVHENVNLGRVSISLNDLGSLKIYYSQGITENQDDLSKKMWYDFLKEMRLFSMRRLLRFDTRDIAKTNLDKNDFQHLAATQGPKEEEPTMNMNESNKKQRVSENRYEIGQQMAQDGIKYSPEKENEIINMMADYMKKSGMSPKEIRYYLSYDEDYIPDQLHYLPREGEPGLNESRWNQKSSKKTSRAVKGATEVIVRHHSPVDEMYPGARSQKKNIKAIYIQNRDGERFKYPFIHPAGAFAMAQHVDHGGVPHDPAGKAIVRMSEQIAQLQEFSRQVQHTQLHDDAMGIKERAVGRLQELKAQIESLSKRHHYEAWTASFVEQDEPLMADLDPVTMETYKAKFTETNFKEDLASFFPLLHSIMQEANTVDLEDYVQESTCSTCHCDPCECDDEDKEVKESAFKEFTEWAEAVEQGKLTDDQIESLKQAMSELPNGEMELGVDGQTAFQFFSSFGLEDSDLEAKLKGAYDLDPTTDPIEVLQVWAQENYPELLVTLGLSGTGQEDPAPAEPAPEAPPVQPPVAEGKDGNMVQEVAKIVKSFYNRDNPEVGPFRGGEGIALDVKKQIAEKFGEKAGEQAAQLAEKFMEKLTMEWQQRHGTPVNGDDGLARLKELVGNIKAKVEGKESHQAKTTMKHVDASNASDSEKAAIKQASKDIKPGVKGYSDRADALKAAGVPDTRGPNESGPDKSQVPAYKRKEQGGDWKMSTKDLEKEKTNSPTSSAGLARMKSELGMSEELESIMRLANHKK